MDYQQAVQALANAEGQAAPATTPDPVSAPQPPAQQPQVQEPVQVQPDAGDAPLDLNVDPNSLPPELQAIYRQMQSGATRKFQEWAPLRQATEQLAAAGVTDPAQVARYAQLALAIERDPATARQVAARINEVYGTGAAAPTSPTTPMVPDSTDNDYDPEDPLVQRLSALEQEIANQNMQQERNRLAEKLRQDEANIRQANPDYDEDDIASLYELSHATGYDLHLANERLIAIKAHAAQRFLQSRDPNGGLTPGQNPVPPGSVATAPTNKPVTLRDATQAAIERMRAQGGMS